MKRIFTLVFGIILLANADLKSQTYSISPNDTIVVTAPYYTITIFDIFQDNISGAPLNLGWKLISNNLVPGWDFSLCDYNTCYVGLPAAGTMATVPVSGQGFLGLNIDPTNIDGTGIVRIYVYDVTDSLNGDTLTWIVSTPAVGIDPVMNAGPSIVAYPNPVTDQLFVTSSDANGTIAIIDNSGRIISEATRINSGTFNLDVSYLPAGTYFLIYQSEAGLIEQKQFIKTQR
jgi:hypothetical protein